MSNIDFNQHIKNTDKFRTPALHYLKHGTYCNYPQGTTEYYNFWQTEQKRCVEGYTAKDGDFITGYHYFYLNYCPIARRTWSQVKTGNVTAWRSHEDYSFPDFWDYDYYYFNSIEEAEGVGKHLCVAKARRKGFSYKGGAMLVRNFFLVPMSKSYVYVSDKQYLTEDGILTKAWDYMDFVDTHTAWGKKRQVKNTDTHRRASYKVTDEYGNTVETGYKSEIIGVTLKDKPNKVRGKRAKLILWEEAGSFPELEVAWQIARPSIEHDGVAFGLMIAFGTGGDDTNANNITGLRTAFYNPDTYNCVGFKNIWDTGAEGLECGFYVPQYTNIDARDKSGKRLYMDKDGNTLTKLAKEYILNLREVELKNATSSSIVDRYIAEHATCPAETFTEFSGNIYPKRELQAHLAHMRTNKKLNNAKQVGKLIRDNGKLNWVLTPGKDITEYPLPSTADPHGAIVIWEHPDPDPPLGLYIIGIDPYDQDSSVTTSLGSIFVYKRMQDFEKNYDTLVAEFTGRPESADEFYETAVRLAEYYNGRIMFENNNKGIYVYFMNKHKEYLLADQPDVLMQIVKNTTINRKKGSPMNAQIKSWCMFKIKDWLEEEVEPGHLRLETIKSIPLLQELIMYNDRGNFDRHMAICQLMIYREELYNQKVHKAEHEQKQRQLFNRPLFKDKDIYDYLTPNKTDNKILFTGDTQVLTFTNQGLFNIK
jgi:hypothetical protein